MSRFLRVFAAAMATLAACMAPATAGTHVAVGVGFGYYAPWPYYPPPPVYYVPPPVIYYPPTYYMPPQPTVTPSGNCRVFNGDATHDETHTPFYGTACLGPDGKWHVAN